MTPVHVAIVASYVLLCVAALGLARAHYADAQRSGVLPLVFVALKLVLEAAEHAMTVWAWVHSGPVASLAMASVVARIGISWLRLGVTWGLLLGVRWGVARVGSAGTGWRAAWTLAWAGYRGYCSALATRVRRRAARR